ncbi:hypothetical protein FHR83_006369 [Actinoplanes campanulatus]|uniref:Uncharacterized protein n=1 Tax=Actinoplanes campanulatus TaxID=113559 RepID=A0A7W5AM67_9ACTN|nr:hypothetical protein [Actinoplanes campanulatus]MBB3098670.1 hypothetical protein [Actinoplanes campanulatus]GGN36423.1 hypothetical protein GCM10010109_61370 [Actinoplanes campanulatus]GID39360.1 hypothetical protein Aca09nite_58660 [Actinoplanes campanulatus]
MSGINLALADADELTELLQFIDAWLTTDQEHLNPSLQRFAGHPAYDTDRLKATLARFVFLLGGDTDGDLFEPPATTA